MKKLLYIGMIAASMFAWSCGSNSGKTENADSVESQIPVQPVESGHYSASYYDISGTNARKGKFDGRMYVALGKDQSAIYVYENGNRAKIDYMILLEKPFEKNDSGFYKTADSKGAPVIMYTDSATYKLTFEKGESNVTIDFDRNPLSTSSAFEIIEKINEQKSKNK